MPVPFSVRWIMLALCMSLVLSSSVAAAGEGNKTAVLRVGVYDNAPLSFWKDEKPQGFFIDIWELIAKQEGIPYAYERCALQECLEKTRKGVFDVMLVVANTPVRREFLDFPATPVFSNWATVYARKNLTIESILDLSGKRIAVETGDIHGSVFRDLIKSFGITAEIVQTGSFGEVFSFIHEGRVDAGIVARTFGLREENRFNVKRTSVIFNPVNVSVAFPKGRQAALAATFDRVLPPLIADHNSAYHAVFDRWMGMARTGRVPSWVFPALGFAVTGLVMGMVTAYVFRRQVRMKTGEVRKQEERFRAIFNASNDAMFTLRNGLFSDCNAQTVSLFGCSRVEDLIGRSPADFSPPLQPDGKGSGESAEEKITAALAGETVRFEWKHKKVDGTLFDVDVLLSVLEIAGDKVVLAVVRDISERKEYEHQILETSSLLKRLLEYAPTPITFLDMNNRVMLWNNAAGRIYGWTEQEVYGKELPYMSSKERMNVYEQIREVHETGQPMQYESTRTTRAGDILDVLVIIAPLKALDGTPQGIIGIHLDVTEQKASSRKVLETTELLRTIVDNAPTPILLLDPEYRVRMWNPAAERVYGWKADEVLGEVVPYLAGEEKSMVLSRLDNAFLDGSPTVYESRRFAKDGSELCILAASAPVRGADGSHYGVVGVHIDITEQKRAREIAQYSRELFEKAFRANPGPTAITDVDSGRIADVNDRWCDLFGYRREEMLGKTTVELGIFDDPEDRKRAMVQIAESGSFRDILVNVRTKQGELRTLLWSGEQVQLNDRPVLLSLLLDITEQQRLQRQLLQSQKMDAVGRLAGGIAHDFNNLLTAIIGYASFIAELAKTAEKKDFYARQIIDVANRAAGLTKSLLIFSRKQEAEFSVLNIQDLLNDILKLIGRVIGEDIEVTTRVEGVLLPVLGNAGQLGQVIINLATNARDAMPEGGRISIAAQQVYIDNSFVDAHEFGKIGSYIMISVSDTGSGIAKEHLKMIFEPFFTTKDQGKGTGLGLSIVYGIVEAHGGFIDVYSEVGCGTTFKIYLPVVSAGAEAGGAGHAGPLPEGSETILLAEDDDLIRNILTQALEMAGYRVLACKDGIQACTVFLENADTIALLLTDVIMPKMNGKILSEEAMARRPEVKVLFLSGYTADILEEKMHLDSRFDIMYKPVSPAELVRKVRQVLDN